MSLPLQTCPGLYHPPMEGVFLTSNHITTHGLLPFPMCLWDEPGSILIPKIQNGFVHKTWETATAGDPPPTDWSWAAAPSWPA